MIVMHWVWLWGINSVPIMTCIAGLSNQTGDKAVTELKMKDITFAMNMINWVLAMLNYISSDYLHTIFGYIVLKFQKRSDIEIQ